MIVEKITEILEILGFDCSSGAVALALALAVVLVGSQTRRLGGLELDSACVFFFHAGDSSVYFIDSH